MIWRSTGKPACAAVRFMASDALKIALLDLAGENIGMLAVPCIVIDYCPSGLEVSKLRMHSCQRERERRSAEGFILASAGIPFKLGNAKQAATVLSSQSLGDGRFQLSPPPVVALIELVGRVF